MDQLIIEGRFNGPAGTGNGGYTAGVVACRLAPPAGSADGATAQVTLRTPPPLDTPLRVAGTGTGGLTVSDGERLVAEAALVPTAAAGEPVAAVPYQEAVAASAGYPGLADHPFPTCYVCGPRREPGDGLRIFPGPLPDGRTAAGWLVPDEAAAVTVWAALDCPGGWAILRPGRAYVLGRMAAVVAAVPPPGTECVVVGAVSAAEGRKADVRTALYTGGGDLLAHAWSTWIAIEPAGEPVRG